MSTAAEERDARNRARNAAELARLGVAEPILAAVDYLTKARTALRRAAMAEPDVRAEAIPAALENITAAADALDGAQP